MIRWNFTRIGFCALVLIMQVGPVYCQELIVWGRSQFPPFSILSGEHKGQGISDYVTALVQRHLTGYTHENVEAPIPRITSEIKSGSNWCWVGALKTAERETFAVYSLPYQLTVTQKIIVRRERQSEFEKLAKGSLSLEALLQDKQLHTATLRDRAYNPEIDALVARFPSNLYSSIQEGLQMLMADRLDYLLEYPTVSNFHALTQGKPGALVSLPFKEMSTVLSVYVICPKNNWGRKVVGAVNIVLIKERTLPSYRAAMERWNDEATVKVIRQNYDAFLSEK
ncbi:MAG: TIGR02285 family protein [Proteobacteria bacterium]|nr:TIGR02285 family protein [Pseudomonadota bacterium]